MQQFFSSKKEKLFSFLKIQNHEIFKKCNKCGNEQDLKDDYICEKCKNNILLQL